MAYDIRQSANGPMARIEGALNFSVNREFEVLLRQLRDSGKHERVTLDLSGVTQIDSVGLGLLYIALEDLKAVGSRLAIASPSACVQRLMKLTESEATFDLAG